MRAAAVAVALLAAPSANAAEGGGNSCPWAQDVKLDMGGKILTVPQAIFDPKNPNPVVDGYRMQPNVEALSLRIYGPRGEVWQAALTRIAGGKRCMAFYAGRAEPVEEEPSSDRVAER